MRKYLLSVVLILSLLWMNIIPLFAQSYSVQFEVVSTSPIGATIRASIIGSPKNVRLVVLNLEDIQKGILPKDARQQDIKYTELNEVTTELKETKTPVLGLRDAKVSDFLSDDTDLKGNSKKVNDELKKQDTKALIKDLKKDNKVDENIKSLPDQITDVVGYDVKQVNQEVKKELYKSKALSKSVLFDVDKPMTLEATVTSGGWSGDGWGSSGVLALIIDGEYYYDMSHSSWWSTAYHKRIAITIPTTNIDADLTDFPLKLWLSSSSGTGSTDVTTFFDELSYANRKKMAVTDSTNTTQYYVEIVSGSTEWTAETVELYTKVALDHDATTTLYLYYDASQTDNTAYVGDTTSTPAKAVWDANFSAVYHMNDGADTSHIYDSTSNGLTGTKKGAAEPTVATGLKGKAQQFDGINDYIAISGTINSGTTHTLDFACYDTSSDVSVPQMLLDQETNRFITYWMGSGSTGKITQSGWGTTATFGDVPSANNWHTLSYLDNGATSVVNLSLNGSSYGTTDIAWTARALANITIGSRYSHDQSYFKGYISEFRVSSVIRSAAWVKATNYSERDTLVSYGSEVTISVPSVTTSAASDVGCESVTLNGNVTNANNGDLTVRGFKWDTDSGVPYANDWNEATSSTGTFTHALSGLTQSTTYYFVAYATNQYGTGYGSELNFETLSMSIDPPTNFTVTMSGNNIILTWINNPVADKTLIVKGSNDYPTSITDGEQIYFDNGTTYTDIDANNEISTAYYSAFSYESSCGYSTGYNKVSYGGSSMILIALLLLAVALTALGYIFKLDFMKFIAGIGWIFVSFYMYSNYTWFGTAQWTLLLIGFFGLALPLWIHTIWTMSLNRKSKMQEKAKELYTDGDNDEVDAEWERDMQEWNRKPSKPTLRTQRKNSLYGKNI